LRKHIIVTILIIVLVLTVFTGCKGPGVGESKTIQGDKDTIFLPIKQAKTWKLKLEIRMSMLPIRNNILCNV
jgi:hypothetical protein